MKKLRMNQLAVGDIVTTKDGRKYVVTCDDFGTKDLIKLDKSFLHNTFSVDGELPLGTKVNYKDGKGAFVKVERFEACPAGNRLSEALKTVTGAEYKYPLSVVFDATNADEIEKLKAQIAELNAKLEELV